jgi:hypothetical protein
MSWHCFGALLLAGAGVAPEASAAWLHCNASGHVADGKVAYFTTVADVGPMPPKRLAEMEHTLSAYVLKTDPRVTELASKCYAFDDQVDANAHYSRLLNKGSRSLGWDHMVVLEPSTWLPESDSGADILHP